MVQSLPNSSIVLSQPGDLMEVDPPQPDAAALLRATATPLPASACPPQHYDNISSLSSCNTSLQEEEAAPLNTTGLPQDCDGNLSLQSSSSPSTCTPLTASPNGQQTLGQMTGSEYITSGKEPDHQICSASPTITTLVAGTPEYPPCYLLNKLT